jgi:hypothetical protein
MADDSVRASEYWKKRAEESRAKADDMPAGEARVLMLQIARMYGQLAVCAAVREARAKEKEL